MGYILPITHYSYINYEHRMRKNEKSPHFVDKPSKVVFNSGNSDIENAYDRELPYGHFEKAVKVKRYVQVELTGKGQHVNVKV